MKNLSRVLAILLIPAVAVLIILAFFTYKEIQEEEERKSYSLEYIEYVEQASEEFGVRKEIIFAVIYVESSFRPDVVSDSGAVGLMQMKPKTFQDMQRRLGEEYPDEALTDPAVNIRYGTYYLCYLYNIFDDWEVTFAAYNGGMGNVRKWLEDERYSEDGKTLKDIPFEETARYVKKINAALEKYKEILNSEV